MRLRSAVLLSLLVVAHGAAAEVYRWVDGDGNVIFSDTPQEGAEAVELGETTVVPAIEVPREPRPGQSGDGSQRAVAYESVSIASPANEETLRNLPTVDVSVALSPPLQARFGHELQLIVDGQPFAEPGTQTTFSLPEVYRGSHTLQAVVLGPDGEEIARSPQSVFFMHRTSVQGGGGGGGAVGGASPAGGS